MGTFIKQSDLKSKIPSILWNYLSVLLLLISCEKEPETVTDIDGNEYPTVTIGTQVWMGENLKVTRLNDGTDIPLVTSNTLWAGLTTPGYCHYDNSWSNALLYGNLYNWYTVNTGKLCPTGWHVPTNGEWTTLLLYLGGDTLVGGKLKDTGTAYWENPNRGATNETEFSALAGGVRTSTGPFDSIKKCALFWSATEDNYLYGIYLGLFYYTSNFSQRYTLQGSGMSIRCIHD